MFKLVEDTERILCCKGNKLDVKCFQKCCQTSKSILIEVHATPPPERLYPTAVIERFVVCLRDSERNFMRPSI